MADLQAILPPGFTAIANPAGSANTSITLNFFLDQRFQPDVTKSTTYGPTSAMLVTATVLNSNVSEPRQEIVFPSFEASSSIDQLNAAFGPGTATKAKVKGEVSEHNGNLKFVFSITDAATGFDIAVAAFGADTLIRAASATPSGCPSAPLTVSAPTPLLGFQPKRHPCRSYQRHEPQPEHFGQHAAFPCRRIEHPRARRQYDVQPRSRVRDQVRINERPQPAANNDAIGSSMTRRFLTPLLAAGLFSSAQSRFPPMRTFSSGR